MLRVLVYLAALSQLAAATTTFTTSTVSNIANCPIKYYGQSYTKVYVNITPAKLAICFTGPYRDGAQNTCILIDQNGESTNGLSIFSNVNINPGSSYHKALPQLKGTSSCSIQIYFKSGSSNNEILLFRQFDGKTQVIRALNYKAKDRVYKAYVNGSVVEQWTVKQKASTYKMFRECWYSDKRYEQNSQACAADGSAISCDASGIITVGSCGGRCKCPVTSCTVTGSTVIGFSGNLVQVPDRCAYPLMSLSGVQLLAVFRDRRRKDVSLLDRLILERSGVQIHMQQGGRVQLGNTTLTLGTKPQVHNSVALSKDQAGVTAAITVQGYTISIFFDGYTAQIQVTGKKVTTSGLCGTTQPFSQMRSSKYSPTSCTVKYTDPADKTINCATMTKRCNALMEAPFTACHNYINPASFIKACSTTLCKYPAVDGFSQCQFLEAYARACSPNTGNKLEAWRSKAGCSPPQALCPGTLCGANEFCAKAISGETSCFCRAVFASKYRTKNAFGEPTVCSQNSATITLVNCLLEEKGIDHSVLHLNDQKCKGQMDKSTRMVTFHFDSSNTCGTVITANTSHVMYKNSIMVQKSSKSNVITRHDQAKIDFSCFYKQPDIRTMSFRIKDSSVVQEIVSGAWKYTLTMKAYSDASRTKAIESNTDIRLQQTVWVELKTDGLDDKLVAVVTDSCWATNEASPGASLKYNLITKGCANPADQTVKVHGNGLGTSNYYSFNMFQFSGKSGQVYLHCKLNLCVKKNNTTCAPSCSKSRRRRRSATPEYEDENPAFISMAWTS